MTSAQLSLNNYFSQHWPVWDRTLDMYEKSGRSLIQKIKPGESVIDVGCGANLFKSKIPNLIGIDPAFEQADFKCTIEEFDTADRFDVAFCLGSINFGSCSDIERQITKVISLLKDNSRIYWRCNPGQQDHRNEQCSQIEFYPWSVEEHVRLSDKFGFSLVECVPDGNRLYAEWVMLDSFKMITSPV